MRILIMGLLLLSVITGCNTINEEELLEDLVSSSTDFYMLYVVTEKDKGFTNVDEVQDDYNVDFNQLLSKDSLITLLYGSVVNLNPGDIGYEYIETLELNKFPAFVIFDSEQLVFKSPNIEEVNEFLSTREETPGMKLRKELEIWN